MAITNQKSKPSAKSSGNRNGPKQRGEPKELSVRRSSCDFNEFGFNLSWVECLAVGEVTYKLAALPINEIAVLFERLPAMPSV